MKSLLAIITVCILAYAAEAQPYTIQQYLSIKSANSPAFSPDGKRIAYITNVTGTQQVWVVDLPNGKPRWINCAKRSRWISFQKSLARVCQPWWIFSNKLAVK